MGVLNVTPDSFSDGGVHGSAREAIAGGLALVAAGASILDVGGESTRPGATRVDASEQIRRVVPVIEGLRSETSVPISIDTTRASVAEAALAAGADIVNDVAAGTEDERRLEAAAGSGAGLVLMHRLRRPDEDRFSDAYASGERPRYDDVVSAVRAWLLARVEAALARGVDASAVAVDPGLGFGKTVEQNYALLRAGSAFVSTGYPVLCAASRKSFVGRVAGVESAAARDVASTAVTLAQYAAGVRLFRVHAVGPHREALSVWRAITEPAGSA